MKTTKLSAIAEARRSFCSALVEEAARLTSKAAWIRDLNRAYPGEAHNVGAAFEAIANANMALDIAQALLRADHTTGSQGATGARQQAAA